MKLGRNVRRLVPDRVTLPNRQGEEGYPDTLPAKTQQRRGFGSVSGMAGCEKRYRENDACSAASTASTLSCGTSFYPDYPDNPDKEIEIKGFQPSGYPAVDPVYPDYPDRPPWHDDRAWIALWRDAGPMLAERCPVLEAWLAAAPPPPLPRRLAALELARVARNYRINVEVGP